MHEDISPSEDTLLRSIYLFHYVTVSQMTRLLYSQGSAKYVSALLFRLFQVKYVHRKPLPSQIQKGSVPYVYYLAEHGRDYLKSLGYDFTNRLFPSEEGVAKSLHLWHTLTINDVLIEATLLPATLGLRLRLAEFRHDLSLKHELQGKPIPDGWLDFRIAEKEQQCIWLEIDRDTQKRVAFKEKIARILTYIKTGYEQDFGTPSVTVAVATTGKEYRVGELRSWCEQQLTDMHETHEADVFRFTRLPDVLTPQKLFIDKTWYRPFDRSEQSLLEV